MKKCGIFIDIENCRKRTIYLKTIGCNTTENELSKGCSNGLTPYKYNAWITSSQLRHRCSSGC